ncbi:hypothetical protein BDQ17DRAFT_1430222 [Cyathus striatus]|nr:hypothetical protein BDQ17DRAFT_1430222 [Cyathus striatus]
MSMRLSTVDEEGCRGVVKDSTSIPTILIVVQGAGFVALVIANHDYHLAPTPSGVATCALDLHISLLHIGETQLNTVNTEPYCPVIHVRRIRQLGEANTHEILVGVRAVRHDVLVIVNHARVFDPPTLSHIGQTQLNIDTMSLLSQEVMGRAFAPTVRSSFVSHDFERNANHGRCSVLSMQRNAILPHHLHMAPRREINGGLVFDAVFKKVDQRMALINIPHVRPTLPDGTSPSRSSTLRDIFESHPVSVILSAAPSPLCFLRIYVPLESFRDDKGKRKREEEKQLATPTQVLLSPALDRLPKEYESSPLVASWSAAMVYPCWMILLGEL